MLDRAWYKIVLSIHLVNGTFVIASNNNMAMSGIKFLADEGDHHNEGGCVDHVTLPICIDQGCLSGDLRAPQQIDGDKQPVSI